MRARPPTTPTSSPTLLATATNGGVVEVNGNTIAIQGSGTADAPYVAFHLDLSGQNNVLGFDARDLDASADDATQQVAVQYRVGATGAFTNLPDGYIADATTAGSATQVTAKDVALPVAVDNQAERLRPGHDDQRGRQRRARRHRRRRDRAPRRGPRPSRVIDPGPQTSTVGDAITPLTIAAGGGTPPYDVSVTGLPAGLTIDAATDSVSGTPTTAGVSTSRSR